MFSSAAAKVVCGFGGRPAPVTPEAASTMTPVGLDQAGPHERGERQRGARRVATGHGHQIGARELVAEQLGDAVGGLGQQLGRRVLLVVPLGVERRVLEAEVGGGVDDPLDPSPQLRDQLPG